MIDARHLRIATSATDGAEQPTDLVTALLAAPSRSPLSATETPVA